MTVLYIMFKTLTILSRSGIASTLMLFGMIALSPFVKTGSVSAENIHERRFNTGLDDELVFIHAYLNYAPDPDTERCWERGLFSSDMMRLSYGSISKHRLFEMSDIVVNHDIGHGWGFRAHVHRLGTDHHAEDETSAFMGFRKHLVSNVHAVIESNLHHHKDRVDGALGLLGINNTGTDYIRILFRWDDLAWNERNTSGGDESRPSLGCAWTARKTLGRVMLFSSGRLSSGFRRSYDDPMRSPGLSSHNRRANDVSCLLAWQASSQIRIEGAFSHHLFDEQAGLRNISQSYDYRHTVSHGVLRGIHDSGVWRVRGEAHGIRHARRVRGRQNFRYTRIETLPALFVMRRIHSHAVELGYFGSIADWKFDSSKARDYSRHGYIDKLMIAWDYAFSESARARISLSHVVNIRHFGGGNFQYYMRF